VHVASGDDMPAWDILSSQDKHREAHDFSPHLRELAFSWPEMIAKNNKLT